jgi:hypothetical protein
MSEVFRQLPEVIGRASAVRSTKRTTEVVPVGLAKAEEKRAAAARREMLSEGVRGVPLHSPWQSFSITTTYTLPPSRHLSCLTVDNTQGWA